MPITSHNYNSFFLWWEQLTQTVLKDSNNCLKAEYCNSTDGIHMGKNAYEVILQYIRTHAVPD